MSGTGDVSYLLALGRLSDYASSFSSHKGISVSPKYQHNQCCDRLRTLAYSSLVTSSINI